MIKEKYGLNLVAVIKEVLPNDVKGFREYFKGPIYVDEEMAFFRSLTSGKFVKHNAVFTLLRPTVWMGIKRAQSKGIKNGSLSGESSINGGIYIVSKDGIQFQHNEEVGVLPPVNDILAACQKLTDREAEPVKVPNGDVQRKYCTDTVCTL